MNSRPSGLTVAKARTGFRKSKSAEGFAPITVAGYEHNLRVWVEHQGDMDIRQVQPELRADRLRPPADRGR